MDRSRETIVINLTINVIQYQINNRNSEDIVGGGGGGAKLYPVKNNIEIFPPFTLKAKITVIIPFALLIYVHNVYRRQNTHGTGVGV